MINIPFNHQPTSVAVKTGSYTVPAGSYARVTVSLSANARGRIVQTGIGQDPNYAETTSDAMSKTGTFFVPTGTDLDVTSSVANNTDSGQSSTSRLSADASSAASFSIDSTMALECKVGAFAITENALVSVFDYMSANVTGDVDARYIVELFNELT